MARDIELEEIADANEEPETLVSSRSAGYKLVIAGFLANFMVFGIGFTFGVFQDYYLSSKGPLYRVSVSKVSLIGSIATSLTYLLAIFHNILSRYFNVWQTMLAGSVIASLGMILASYCTETWQFAMTQGLMCGIGSSLVYIPPVVNAPPYFSDHRGIAMGIIFAGTGFGGLAMANFSQYLLNAIGWKWALRTLGLLFLVICSPLAFMVKPHSTIERSDHSGRVNMRVAKSWKFFLHMFGGCFQAAGYLIPVFFMSSYSQSLGYSYNQGAAFIGINNAVNAISKVVVGYFADRIGRVNMLLGCCLLSTISVLSLWLVPTRGTFITFVVFYGIVSGPIISLLPTCLAEIFGMQNYKSLTGFMYFSRGVGNLLGSPIAGLFVHQLADPIGFRYAIVYNGLVFVVNSLCFMALRGIVAYQNDWKLIT